MAQKAAEERQNVLGPRRPNFKKKWQPQGNSSNQDLAAVLAQLLKKDDGKDTASTKPAASTGEKKLTIKQLKAIKPCS